MEDDGILWPSKSIVVSLGQDLLATILLLMTVASIGFHSSTWRGSTQVTEKGANCPIVLDAKSISVNPTLRTTSASGTVIETVINRRVDSNTVSGKPVRVAVSRSAYVSLNGQDTAAKGRNRRLPD